MSRTLASLAALAILAAPAAAAGYGFSSSYTGASIPTIGALNVTINADLVREVHSTARSESYGTAAIAPSDAEDLVASLREELEKDLSRTGAYAPMVAQPVGTLNVTIERAAPSNPAHTENGRNRGLDFRSAGRGGATVTAELLGPDGAPVAEYSYRWEESSFDVGALPRIGWYGAERAFERFSSRLARDLSDHAGGAAS